ncbi:acetyl-CoA carboxylase biotin carboxyl carrier protein subunit [Aureibaculum luteum]|uniref:acetyl-CoA carboxylase biotin carboxyl carrier protein subunit n=1 Tax=Aureibaculum luteum TaxID=1548456 RepID=UPI000E528FBC|nr:acetyl-CoA carboxylase biotin carboxyl carrier protein subunit [Aureibaculum luteum]
MNTNYKVNVNKTFEFDITKAAVLSLDAVEVGEGKYHLLQNHQPYHIEILNSDFNKKKYIIKVNNNTFELDINDDLDKLINEMGFATSSKKTVDSIKAPMPGLILEINVKEGQNVKENDPLLILEAMKMENVITSPHDGIIKTITAIKGNTVEKGSVLIEFAP